MGCTASSDKSSLELRLWKLYLQSMKERNYVDAHDAASQLIELNLKAWRTLNSIPLDKVPTAIRSHLTSLAARCGDDIEGHVETFFRIREKRAVKDEHELSLRSAYVLQAKADAAQAEQAKCISDLNSRLMRLKLSP
jgi:hypothetical protein